MQFEVLPADATYNHTTNAPNKATSKATDTAARRAKRAGEMLRSRYSFQRAFMI